MITIVFAHPWHGSFNKAILDEVIKNIEQAGKEYNLLDLYKDQFNPVFSEEELAQFSKGVALDPLVKKYQKSLKESESVIFIFPVWWYDMPAMMKGFVDKVFLKEFAYRSGKTGLIGLLTNITNSTVITTSDGPKWYLRWIGGNIIKGGFIKNTLKGVGIKQTKWIHCGQITKITDEKRAEFLEKIRVESF
ncbi:NAD(P)H-dependent oxidoreductase [Enterococcus sp. LJL99]